MLKDKTKLSKKVITNKRGHKQTVWVKATEKLKPYEYEKIGRDFMFTTDKNTKYRASVWITDSAEWNSKKEEWIDKDKDWRMKIDFGVETKRRNRRGYGMEYDYQTATNKGEMHRVMLTLTDIVKENIKKYPHIKTIAFETSGEDEDDNRRLNLYLRMIKRFKPNAKIIEGKITANADLIGVRIKKAILLYE